MKDKGASATAMHRVLLQLMRIQLVIALFIGVMSVAIAQPAGERRYAFVVTNQNYVPELNPLQYPHSDGRNISAALKELGFNVRLLQDSSRAEFERQHALFISDLKAAGPNAVAFFYFSGHCVPDEAMRANFLILNEAVPPALPGSVHLTNKANLDRIGVPLRRVTQSISTLDTKASFVVIDSHLDAAEPALLEKPLSPDGVNTSRRGMMLMARGRPGIQAADNNDFSRALAGALLTPGLDAHGVFKQVQVQVAEMTNGKQVPWIEDRLLAPYHFQPSTGIPANTGLMPGNVTGRRVALVIGNSHYAHSATLANPENDARAIAEALRKLGFADVQAYYDLDKQGVIKALRSFGEVAAAADWVVVYYAGHGMEVAGKNYFVPVDARLDKEEDIEDEAVPVSRLFDRLAGAKGLKIVILDACRDNPLAARASQRSARRNLAIGKGLAKMDAESGTLIALAADPGMPSFDGAGKNSPYATALLQHIGEPGLDVRLMFGKVYDTMHELMQGKQEPWIQAKLPGRQYFFNPK